MLEGKNVVQTQSYGIASRGGFSRAEVIIAVDEIIFQQVQEPDMALALTEEAMEKYAPLSESGVPVFYDTSLLAPRTGKCLYGFPFTEMAGKLGHAGTANMIALGAMSAVTGMVSLESLARVVVNGKFKGKTAEMNVKALHAGGALIGEASSEAIASGPFQGVPGPARPDRDSGSVFDEGCLRPSGPSDYDVAVDFSICKQCGYCKEVCNRDVFELSSAFNSSGYRPMAAPRSANCTGCLKCLMVCPEFAVGIEPRRLPASLPVSNQSEHSRKENAS